MAVFLFSLATAALSIALAIGIWIGRRHEGTITKLTRDARYWKESYEALVKQTGRDLNDGLGRDPRSQK